MPRRHRGLSLMEVLVSVSVFVTFFIAVMNAWPVNAGAIQRARLITMATQVAEKEMEATLTQGFDSLASRSGSDSVSAIVGGSARTFPFSYSVTVKDQTTGTRVVSVDVQWREGEVTRHVQCETLRCDYD